MSPDTQCPNCDSIINDRLAYYISRVLRGLGVSFSIVLLIFFAVFILMPDKSIQMQETVSLLAMVVLAVLSVIFIYMQTWSFILTRIANRGLLVILIVFLPILLAAWALESLKILKPDYPLVVALGLILGVIVALASFVVFRINVDTYDYVRD